MKYIEPVVSHLVKIHGTNNPFEIATQKDIKIIYKDLGETLGFFFTFKRIRMIHIHNGLNDAMRRLVCAHELGHAILHPNVSTPFMKRHTLMSVDRIEQQANKFAACLLFYGSELIEGETKEQFCLRNGVPMELALYL